MVLMHLHLTITHEIAIGHNVTGNGANTVVFGNGANDSAIAFGATSISAPSDIRLKENIFDDYSRIKFY